MGILCLAFLVFAQVQLHTAMARLFPPITHSREAPEPILPAGDGPKAHWFTQKLDHFNESNNATWKQRYFYNDHLYELQKDGYGGDELPLFLMIGGEQEIEGGWVNGGFWVDVGTPYRALFIFVEHRFYGKSHPTNDMSIENLKYLTSRQALADLDYFIAGMKKKFGMTDKNIVVVFGGSYSGALAAWVRLKYPDTVFIAHASSAPIEAKFDFSGYYEVCYKSIAAWDTDCAKTIQKAAENQTELMKTNEGLEQLSKTFKTCRKLTTEEPLDVNSFFKDQGAVIGNVIQYNGTQPQNIPDICNLLKEGNKDDPLESLAYYLTTTYETQYGSSCTGSSYQGDVDSLKNVNFSKDQSRQWTWQTCNEFGFFMTAENSENLFEETISIDIYKQICKDVFGIDSEKTQQGVDATNNYYGGKDYKMNQTVFTQGSVDPWQALGITKGNGVYEAVYIENASHVQDQDGPKDTDSPGLKKGREEIKKILMGWITSPNIQELADQQKQQQQQ